VPIIPRSPGASFAAAHRASTHRPSVRRLSFLTLLHFALSLLQVLRFVLPLAEEEVATASAQDNTAAAPQPDANWFPRFALSAFALHQFSVFVHTKICHSKATPLFY